MKGARAQGGRGVRDVHDARLSLLRLPRSRRRSRGREPRRVRQEPRRDDRYFAEKMQATGVKLLWGTANLFSHPRYMAGAATNPDPDVFAYAAAQVKNAIDATHQARRRQLRAVGRPRGLRDAAQHRSQARAGAARPLSVDGRRVQAQDRLQGRDPGRAEAAGADQASVRLRRRHRVRLPAALRAREGSQGQYRGRPRGARRTFVRARDRDWRRRSAFSARSTPTATTISQAGTPTSSPTTRPNSCRRCISS